VKQTVPITENIQVTKSVPQTKYVNVTQEIPATTKVTTTEETILGTQPISTHVDSVTRGVEQTHLTGQNIISTNSNINTNINTDIPLTSTTSPMLRGVPGCKHCGGEGQKKSLTGKRMVPCKECVKITGNCLVCKGLGKRPDKPTKKCECMYGHGHK